MKSQDLLKQRTELREKFQTAIKSEDENAFYEAFDAMLENIGESVRAEYDGKLDDMREEMDKRILQSRGVRQLTSEENKYFSKVLDAMKARDPKQALTGVADTMPETVVESVFDDLRANHPLLSRINFIPTGGAVRWITNIDGTQRAVWGTLCADIIKELTSGFRVVNTTLCKLSAFLPVCEAMLDLGPEWLDRYVREVLYEAIANGLEYGIICGTGKDEPIGMNRQVGSDVNVVGGVYPEKEPVAITEFSPIALGNIFSMLAISDNGKYRDVGEDAILIVNPADYYKKIGPATKLLGPDGRYASDIFPYPMTVYRSAYVAQNSAIIGIARQYAAFIGTEQGGRIDASDEAHFIEDERIYKIKLYGNGMPKDDHSFVLLDISGLAPLDYKVQIIDTRAPSNNALLSNLKLSGVTLSPVFGENTTTYTATTTAAGTVISAWAADAAAAIAIDHDSAAVENGGAITFTSGANVIKITVTAEDGKTSKKYTVTVTKS